MQYRISKWIAATAITASLMFGFITPADADTATAVRAVQTTNEVIAATGTTDVIPAAQTGHDADSAVIAKVDGSTVDVPKDPSNHVTVTTRTGEQIGIGIPNGDTAHDARTTASGTTVYTDPASGTATAVQATTSGVRVLFALSNRQSTDTFVIPVKVPSGFKLGMDRTGLLKS